MPSVTGQTAGLIASSEAIYLFTYKDAVGVLTFGAGHTAAAGGIVPRLGQRFTLQECCAILMADLETKYAPRVRQAIKRRLTQNVFDGFLSFDFNTGAILNGTVDDRWNRGDETGAITVLRQYVNAAGKKLPGLVTRRAAESQIISAGKYPSVLKVLVKDTPNSSGRMLLATALPWGIPISTPTVDLTPIALGASGSTVPPPEKSTWLDTLWSFFK